MEASAQKYQRLRHAIAGEALPVALVDLDAVDRNVDALLAPVRGTKKTLRLATKSIRCVELVKYILTRGGDAVRGLMAYSPAEALFLSENGFSDILIAYPTAQDADARRIAEANKNGAWVSIVVDDPVHLEILSRAAAEANTTIPVIVDVDVSYRPFGEGVHLGVRRSPLREPAAVADFVAKISDHKNIKFGGLLAYEAHIAGMGDGASLGAWKSATNRAFKALARGPVVSQREAICAELSRRNMKIPLFNGGGTGSVAFSVADASLTEITAGSGFLDSHLFDHYDGLSLEPAVFFALQVTRRPGAGFVTCQGGGLVASGAAGPDRLPIPALPEGLSLVDLEGAGEVQTPLVVPEGLSLSLGDPVFFRHAKAGELATFFNEYLFVRGERVASRAPTYRGAGRCFH